MGWMIEFAGAIFITSVTGSLMTIVWALIGKRLDRTGFVNVLYYLLWVNAFFYLFPLVYGIWWYGNATGHPTHKGYVFFPTPFIGWLSFWLTILWAAGAVLFFLIYLVNECYSWRKFAGGIAPDWQENELLDEACIRTGTTKRKIRLYHSYHAKVPFLKGALFPRIILTAEPMEKEQMQCVFVHELNHFVQKDLVLKYICAIIFCIHWYNPLVWWYRSLVYRWCEYACDNRSIHQVDNWKKYALTLVDMAGTGDSTYGLVSTWFEKKTEVTRRVERIMRYSKMKHFSRKSALVLCAVMVLCSSVSVYAAADWLGKAYVLLYNQTEVSIYEETTPPVISEYDEMTEQAGEWDEDSLIIGELIRPIGKITDPVRRGTGFAWDVETGTMIATQSFYMEQGTSVRVTVSIMPDTVSVDAGLILPDNVLWYVSGTSIIDHTFNVNVSGNYRVFVRNKSGTDVEVGGSVFFVEE